MLLKIKELDSRFRGNDKNLVAVIANLQKLLRSNQKYQYHEDFRLLQKAKTLAMTDIVYFN
jgi:hypothetical protein